MDFEALDLPQHQQTDWQPLPARGRWISALTGFLVGAFIAAIFAVPVMFWTGKLDTMFTHSSLMFAHGLPWLSRVLLLIAIVVYATWLAVRRHMLFRWRLNQDGLALRSGRLFFRDVRVPLSRVQYLDIQRGPLVRAAGLSTLVVHTAGTHNAAVRVPLMDQHDAERLRDVLAAVSKENQSDD